MGKRKNKLESALADLEQQGLLLDIPEHPVEKEARETKQCTGALLLKRDIDTYSAIVQALAANKPIRWIKRTFGVGTQTVYAIQQREATKVGTLKERIADWCFMGALAGASRFAEVVADCDDPVAVALATAKMGEFGNLMRGQATQIVATVNVNVDAKAAGEDLMRKAQAMGLQAGENLPLAADSGRLAIPGDSKAPATMEQIIENEEVALSCDTGCDTGRDSDGQISDGGGGGATPTPVRPL